MNNLPAAMPLMENAYKYDQLNRLLEHKAWTSASATPGPMGTTQAYSVLTQDANVGKSAYYNAFSYDADGNILTQKRNGTAALWQMDQLTYNYQSGTNKLTSVGDGVIGTQSLNYDDDLEGQAGNNYTYDQIGNLVSDASEGIASIEWNVYGKIKSITRVNGFSKTVNSVVTYPPDLEFGYDAMGQRVLKIVKTRDANGLEPQAKWKYTYYVRDAAGNVLTTYNRTITVDQTNAAYRIDKYKVDEWTMYGASRLGVQEPSGEGVTAAELKFEPEQNNTITVISRTATAVPTTSLLRKAGEKIYELSNHLGNVLVTVTDRLLPVQNVSTPTQTLYYSADVKSATDYSAFGAPLSGRTNNAPGYRYSMNGQEKDEELGAGVTTAEYWEYDAKLARRWNVDPKDNPSISVYACFENNPIVFNDILGDTVRGANKKSADNTLLILQNTFSYSRHEKLRALFKLGQDGKTFMSISQSDFENAIAGLSDDEKALAYGYFIAINSTSVHTVEAVNRDDKLLTERMVEGKLAKTGEDIDNLAGGGWNMANQFMSYSIIVMDSKASVSYVSSTQTKNEASSPGELLAHEMLGHGVGVGKLTYTNAIQMTNLYRRVQGEKTFFRDGAGHGGLLTVQTYSNVPEYLKLSLAMSHRIKHIEINREIAKRTAKPNLEPNMPKAQKYVSKTK